MSLQCPRCHSLKVASFHHAMKIGAAIGTLGGAARGASAALAGSQAGRSSELLPARWELPLEPFLAPSSAALLVAPAAVH